MVFDPTIQANVCALLIALKVIFFIQSHKVKVKGNSVDCIAGMDARTVGFMSHTISTFPAISAYATPCIFCILV